MAIDTWRWLIQLIQSGSFTRASEELQISQQTLSSRLAKLESKLNCKLVVRSTPLALTRAGEVFVEYAQEQEILRTAMLRRIGEAALGSAGELKVGVSNIRGQVLMPRVLKEFHANLPGVNIKLLEGSNEDLVRMAERDEADVVIARFEDSHPGVRVRPLFREEVVCVVHHELLARSTGLPVAEAIARTQAEGLRALAQCPFMLESINDISGRVAHSELRRAGIKPTVPLESDNMMTMLSLCAAGLGAVFAPTNLLDAVPLVSKNLVRIKLSHDACYNIALGTPDIAEPWTPTQMFIEAITNLFGEGGQG